MKITGDQYFDRFWAAWCKWVPHRKTDKGQALTEFKKLVKSEEFGKPEELTLKIVGAVEFQAKARRTAKEKGVFIPDFPAPHRFLKNRKFEDEIESSVEIERKSQAVQPCACGSPSFTKTAGVWYCERCWSKKFTKSKELLTAGLKLNGGEYMKKTTETREEWIERVKLAASRGVKKYTNT